jgi:hypothetical protein
VQQRLVCRLQSGSQSFSSLDILGLSVRIRQLDFLLSLHFYIPLRSGVLVKTAEFQIRFIPGTKNVYKAEGTGSLEGGDVQED